MLGPYHGDRGPGRRQCAVQRGEGPHVPAPQPIGGRVPADLEKPARKGRVGIGVFMTLVSKTFDLFGKTYVFEVGELAKQATGAALVKQGDSTVLTTVVVFQGAQELRLLPADRRLQQEDVRCRPHPGRLPQA